ncbi:MAG: hypothetical protein MUF47_10370 [Porphyrobacter sp.]|jgi:ElaB/YqjD/DUF883 family membrane-anchored ribosome-binding protein|nr:hypothetical protein [Porphyrobacter sp.]
MSTSFTGTHSGPFQEKVETAAEALKAAASSSHEFSEEASAALASATTELAKLAESLRAHAAEAARDTARFAKHEIEAHPMASLAAALTAVAAVMGVIAVNRRGKHPAE